MYSNVTFNQNNQNPRQDGSIDIQLDPRPWQMKLRQLQKKRNSFFLRDKGKNIAPVFEQCEFNLQDELGEPCSDHDGKEIVGIGPSAADITEKVFLTKPDERGNMSRAPVVKMINNLMTNSTRIHSDANSKLSLYRIHTLVKTLTLTTSFLITISRTILKEKRPL